MTTVLPNPAIDMKQVERAISLDSHPTRPLTPAEHALAEEILRKQGCCNAEVKWRLGELP